MTPTVPESPDRFEPSSQQREKQGKSASKRIALFIFVGAGIIFTLVAMSTLVLDNLGGADQSGYSGFKGKVNRHWNSIITSALMVSLLGAGVEMAAPTSNGKRDREDPRSILAENAASAVAEAMSQIIQREVNRQPTIKIKPGYRFMIFVQRDILFPAAWR